MFDPKFLKQTADTILIDVRKAALAGARMVRVRYDEVTNKINVDIRKSKKGVK